MANTPEELNQAADIGELLAHAREQIDAAADGLVRACGDLREALRKGEMAISILQRDRKPD